MVRPYLLLLAALGVERLFELRRSKRHARAAFARGAVEYGHRHFVWMCALHAAFFPACAAEVVWCHRRFRPRLAVVCLATVLTAQALRYWALGALGERWNVRVIVEPGAPAVTSGPYRFLRHPNYVAVMLEGMAVPLMHGAWLTALAFTTLDAPLLATRIRCEEQALATHCVYDARMSALPRFVPAPRVRRSA